MLAAHLGSELRCEVQLDFDTSRSGPRPGEREPFTAGEVDLAFVCATSYVWLTGGAEATVELVGAAWAPTDPRSGGRAIYFADVLAPARGAGHLRDLSGRRVAYNDDVSLSGYHSLRLALVAGGIGIGEVDLVRSGSHLRSLEMLVDGEVDAAAIDSNVWRRRRRETPRLVDELRPIAALGPHPVQPVVARPDLPEAVRERARAALLACHGTPAVAEAMAAAELDRFVSVRPDDYRQLRAELARPAVTAGGQLSGGARVSRPV